MLQCGKGGDAYSLAFIEHPPCHPLSSWKGAAQKHEDPGSSVLYNIGHQRPLNISGSLKPERGDTTEVLSSGGESDDDTQSEGSTPTKRKFQPIRSRRGSVQLSRCLVIHQCRQPHLPQRASRPPPLVQRPILSSDSPCLVCDDRLMVVRQGGRGGRV